MPRFIIRRSSNKSNKSDTSSASSSTLSHDTSPSSVSSTSNKKHRRRSVFASPPPVTARDSSLYLPGYGYGGSNGGGVALEDNYPNRQSVHSTLSSSYSGSPVSSCYNTPLDLLPPVKPWVYDDDNDVFSPVAVAQHHRDYGSYLGLDHLEHPAHSPRLQKRPGVAFASAVDLHDLHLCTPVTRAEETKESRRARLTSKSVFSLPLSRKETEKDKEKEREAVPVVGGKRKNGAGGVLFRAFGMVSEIWSKEPSSEMDTPLAADSPAIVKSATVPPVIPPRSALRTAPAGPTSSPHRSPQSPRPAVRERESSLYPISPTEPPHYPAEIMGSPSSLSGPSETGKLANGDSSKHGWSFGKKGKKHRDELPCKDPLRVRDGLPHRGSTSGVYTPPTYPGPQGPRPSHFPTHVYTPPGFLLYPNETPESPSRSSSLSSNASDSPQTPISPVTPGRFGQRVTAASYSLKRFSTSLASPAPEGYFTRSFSDIRKSWSASRTPSVSDRDAFVPKAVYGEAYAEVPTYFPPIPVHGAGLGVGLTEKPVENQPDPLVASPRSPSWAFDETPRKGKRKPVPKVEAVEEGMAGVAL